MKGLEGLVLAPETWAANEPTSALIHETGPFSTKLNGIGERLAKNAMDRPFLWLTELRELKLETLSVNFGGLTLLAGEAIWPARQCLFQDISGRGFGAPTPKDRHTRRP